MQITWSESFNRTKNGSSGHVWLSIVWTWDWDIQITSILQNFFCILTIGSTFCTSVIKTINDDTATRFLVETL